MGNMTRAFRTRLANGIYRRTSLPFRTAFKVLAFLRTGKASQLHNDASDAYLIAHTQDYFKDVWKFGYHRTYELLSHFDPPKDPARLRLLTLGPRTEIELYYFYAFFGFSWANIVGVDLVTFSKKIELADFSVALPFENNTFDVIVASHCLEKSRNPEKTRDEIVRVAKSGAHVCVAGNRLFDGATEHAASLPSRFFEDGVYGLIATYGIDLKNIEYMNARSPHGYEIVFRVAK